MTQNVRTPLLSSPSGPRSPGGMAGLYRLATAVIIVTNVSKTTFKITRRLEIFQY